MFINPKIAIQEGWITGLTENSHFVQPNAIDFTLDRMFEIPHHGSAIISDLGEVSNPHTGEVLKKGVKVMLDGREYESEYDTQYKDHFFCIPGHSSVDGMSDFYVELPEGVACLPMVARSTLNRNGMFITSGLYDSGFKGHIGFAIHNVRNDPSYIGVGTRVGQIVFVKSDSAGMYAGGWNHDAGTHYSEQ